MGLDQSLHSCMYLVKYELKTIEYKMKLVGTPQWAIEIQYIAAWIGFIVDRVPYWHNKYLKQQYKFLNALTIQTSLLS